MDTLAEFKKIDKSIFDKSFQQLFPEYVKTLEYIETLELINIHIKVYNDCEETEIEIYDKDIFDLLFPIKPKYIRLCPHDVVGHYGSIIIFGMSIDEDNDARIEIVERQTFRAVRKLLHEQIKDLATYIISK